MKQRVPIEWLALEVIARVGVIAAVTVVPGLADALRTFGVGPKSYRMAYLTSAVWRLKQKGHLRSVERGVHQFLELTPRGKQALLKYQRREKVIKKPWFWDGKWRLVMFDITEKQRRVRRMIRQELIHAGFLQLQRSVWVHPYDCSEYVALLKADKRVGKSVIFAVVDQLEYDRGLKEHFGLDDL